MNERQEKLFKSVMEEYIRTAQPVGSRLVVDKYLKNFSPATVRNEMAELEGLGLLAQPHTSAGRVPTEQGYKKYVASYVDFKKELNNKDKYEIESKIKKVRGGEEMVKILAKTLAEKSNLGVMVGFRKNNVYYTGISNIFSQPEFHDLNLIYNISAVIDHLDEVMEKIYDTVDGMQIKIGSDNSFSSDCASVMVKIKNILISIMGPMRMDYQKNVELINFVRSMI